MRVGRYACVVCAFALSVVWTSSVLMWTHIVRQQECEGHAGPLIDLTGSPPKDDDVILLQSLPKPSSRKKRKVSVTVEQPRVVSPPALKEKEKANPSCAVCLDEMTRMACGPCG